MELCIASSLDPTLAPAGCHVASLFTQYTPYHIEGREWTDEDKTSYADRGKLLVDRGCLRILRVHSHLIQPPVFDCLEEYAPGFRKLVIGYDILTPPDLECVFGLTGGVSCREVPSSPPPCRVHTVTLAYLAGLQNIFHGGMLLDQLYLSRPVASSPGYRTPVKGLYLCGAGSHPGTGESPRVELRCIGMGETSKTGLSHPPAHLPPLQVVV